jgi:hypothetical protein
MLMRKQPVAHGWYTQDVDGPIKDYIEKRRSSGAEPMFRGFRHYEMLWNKGLLMPECSTIRLVWGSGGGQYFIVKGLHEIEGIDDAMAHQAKPGIHDPEKILEEPIEGEQMRFEAHYLERNPVPRVPENKKR